MEYDINGEFMLVTAVLSLIFNIVMMDALHDAPGHDHDHDHGHGHSHGHGHGHSHGEDKIGNEKNASKSKIEMEKT